QELELLRSFADLSELARDRPALEADDEDADLRVHVPRELFRSYLHSLDAERTGLPAAFNADLERALAHYGVRGLEPAPELEQAVYRIFLAHQRAPSQTRPISSLLYRRLRRQAELPAPRGDELRETLDRLVTATQRRLPEVAE